MDALCRFVGVEPPHRYPLFGRLHSTLIHWRVQAHFVSRLCLSQAYQEVWAQKILDGHQLSQYGMSRLMPLTAPAPCGSPKEDWDVSDAKEGELAPAREEVNSGGPLQT